MNNIESEHTLMLISTAKREFSNTIENTELDDNLIWPISFSLIRR